MKTLELRIYHWNGGAKFDVPRALVMVWHYVSISNFMSSEPSPSNDHLLITSVSGACAKQDSALWGPLILFSLNRRIYGLSD